jgi:hypothetical protein
MEEAAAHALERAVGFVEKTGGGTERLYVAVLMREIPAAPLFTALEADQREDGALAAWSGDAAPGIATTAAALERLDALGLLDHPLSERAVGFLLGEQAPDGSFRTARDDDEAWLVRTGQVAGVLAKTPFAPPSALRLAEAFLADRWSVDALAGPTPARIEAYAPLLANWLSPLSDEGLQWCGRELERGFRSGRFEPLAVARVFLRTRARTLPGTRLEGAAVRAALIPGQCADGSFASEDSRRSRVEATLDAMEAILRLAP